MGLREQNRKRLRDEIVQEAVALFAEKGFDAVRVIDIVERVGVSEKTFFNHFPTKLAVLEAFSSQILDAYKAVLRRAAKDPSRPVVVRLKEVVAAWATAYSAGGRHLGDVVAKSGLFFGGEDKIREQKKETQRLLAVLIRQGQKSGEMRPGVDALQLAELLTAMLLVTTANWLGKWWGETGSLKHRLERAFVVFMEGAAA